MHLDQFPKETQNFIYGLCYLAMERKLEKDKRNSKTEEDKGETEGGIQRNF